MEIGLAIQGGGAKFINLLAAAEPFYLAREDGKLILSAVAGTSAGAIVASLLALRASFPRVHEFLRGEGAHLIQDAVSDFESEQYSIAGRCWLLYKAYAGKPLIEPKRLKLIIEKMIRFSRNSAEIPEKIRDVRQLGGTKLLIIASDIASNHAKCFGDDDNFIDALLHSCAVPFLFRTYNDSGLSRFVDGGLSDSLPIEHLLSLNDPALTLFGIGVSDSGANRAPLPENSNSIKRNSRISQLFSYANSLLSASIESGVQRSRKHIPSSRMIDVKGSIGTFDFKNMHQHNNESDSYKEIQKYSQKKLFKYIRTKSSIGSDGIEDGSVPTQAELLKKIGEAIRILKEDRELSILAQRTTVIAHCLKNYADADEEDFDVVINKLSFRVVGGEVRIFEPSLHSQSGQQTHATAWNIKSTESSRQITGLMIPTFPELESSGVKYYLILHRHILGSPDGPVYTFTTQYLVHGSMRGLATTRSDYITQKNTTEWPAEVFEFVLLLPSEFQKSVKPFLRAGNAHLRSLEIPLSELVSDPLLSMPAYTPVGLRAFDVPPETRVGVDFKVVG